VVSEVTDVDTAQGRATVMLGIDILIVNSLVLVYYEHGSL